MKRKQLKRGFWILTGIILLTFTMGARAKNSEQIPPAEGSAKAPEKKLTLSRAIMCEEMVELAPRNETVVFSRSLGHAACFTTFDPVPGKCHVFHKWFQRDQPEARFKLTLKSPKWSSFSQVRLKRSDVGPWRVEITDAKGKIFKTLYFSVTE